jgi:DNA repair protein RecN (Recombination protein N)
MISELQIRDFAIIDELQISFSEGLNILTGETGTGKSIIINAVSMVLGDKASDDLIRTSAKGCVVEALFDVVRNEELAEKLREKGFEAKDTVLMKRVLSRGGKSRAFINGNLANVTSWSFGRTIKNASDGSCRSKRRFTISRPTRSGYPGRGS